MERFRLGLMLIQILDALFTASDIWPVKLVDRSDEVGSIRVGVTPRVDEEREKLSLALGIEPPAVRIANALLVGQTAIEAEWKLTDIGRSVSRTTKLQPGDSWSVEAKTHRSLCIFSSDQEPPR